MKVLDVTKFNKRGKALLEAIEEVLNDIAKTDMPDVLFVSRTQFSKMRNRRHLQQMHASDKFMLLTNQGVLEIMVEKKK